MKKYLWIILALVSACLTMGILFLNRKITGGIPAGITIAYLIIPLLFCVYCFRQNIWSKKALVQSIVGLLLYAVIVGIFELFFYHYGTSYLTPAGNSYTSYGLNAMYPFPGFLFLFLAFIFGFGIRMVGEMIMHPIKKCIQK